MFFDKQYRPSRYDAMTTTIHQYKNINKFRTFINQNYQSFPVSVAQNLFSNQAFNEELADDGVLLERTYLKTFWHVVRCQLIV